MLILISCLRSHRLFSTVLEKEFFHVQINRLGFWTFSILVSLTTSLLIVPSTEQLLSNPDYVTTKLSHFDGPGMQTLLGAIMLAFTSGVFHVAFHVVFFIACLTSLRSKKINVMDFLFQKDRPILNVVRSMGFLLIAIFLYMSIQDFMFTKDYFKTYSLSILFDIAVLIGILSYVVWTVTLIKHRSRKILITLIGIIFISMCPVVLFVV
jgi:hypothetical protein